MTLPHGMQFGGSRYGSVYIDLHPSAGRDGARRGALELAARESQALVVEIERMRWVLNEGSGEDGRDGACKRRGGEHGDGERSHAILEMVSRSDGATVRRRRRIRSRGIRGKAARDGAGEDPDRRQLVEVR